MGRMKRGGEAKTGDTIERTLGVEWSDGGLCTDRDRYIKGGVGVGAFEGDRQGVPALLHGRCRRSTHEREGKGKSHKAGDRELHFEDRIAMSPRFVLLEIE